VCEDHSASNPYDLLCTKRKKTLYVEVKATTTDGCGVFLTPGEVDHARNHKGKVALFIVRSIDVEERSGAYTLSGGEDFVLMDWDVDQGALKPTLYMYQVPVN
jgi:hypothetical protein